MGVNWALGVQQGNAGEAFANSYKQGMQERQQNIAKAAMAALVKDPNNQRALEALAQIDPGAAQQFQSQRTEAMKAQLAQHQESIVKGAQIFREMKAQHPNVPDDQIYQMTLPALAQAGIDTSQMPKAYDKPYVDNALAIANAFHPQSGQGDRFVPLQPGGSLAQIDPQTGQVHMVVMPNPGGVAPGTPASQPPAEAVARLKSNPQEAHQFDEIFGPGASQRALGGQTVAPSGGFPNGPYPDVGPYHRY